MKHPIGQLATELGVNANARCTRCGHERFYLLVKCLPTGEDRLVATHCAMCHHETPVPLTEEITARRFLS